nr:MAG TPA: hypothetical protein [Caudoviricetes sp.]
MPTRNYTQETWGDNMKDRTPKFPGRVKLKPVAGQTDTYDMTRADDPDDTGTPFNTRTMLQNSTAQFLKLPISNPFVDDALRHMPDRIEPIGTVKTSPAMSLGDAWLKCNGAQVSFPDYPQLCQILKNTVGDVTWSISTVGTSPAFKSMSRAVKFKGKWYIAGGYRKKANNSTSQYYTFSVACADAIEGPYTVVYTQTLSGYAEGSFSGEEIGEVYIQLAASDERITAAMGKLNPGSVRGSNSKYVFFVLSSADVETWTAQTCQYPSSLPTNSAYTVPDQHEFETDGTYWAFACGSHVIYTQDPTSPTWEAVKVVTQSSPSSVNVAPSPKLRYINGKWILNSGERVYSAVLPTTWTLEKTGYTDFYATNIVYFSDRYWFFASPRISSSGVSGLRSSSDLKNWTTQPVTGISINSFEGHELFATQRLMVFSDVEDGTVKTTSDPALGWNAVTLPSGSVGGIPSADGDMVMVANENVIAYHDYSTETRLLPTISLSDDTTTFIKAKNELDVFEAGG